MREKMEQRLAERYDELKWLYCELYQNDEAECEYICDMIRRSSDARSDSLRPHDAKRPQAP